MLQLSISICVSMGAANSTASGWRRRADAAAAAAAEAGKDGRNRRDSAEPGLDLDWLMVERDRKICAVIVLVAAAVEADSNTSCAQLRASWRPAEARRDARRRPFVWRNASHDRGRVKRSLERKRRGRRREKMRAEKRQKLIGSLGAGKEKFDGNGGGRRGMEGRFLGLERREIEGWRGQEQGPRQNRPETGPGKPLQQFIAVLLGRSVLSCVSARGVGGWEAITRRRMKDKQQQQQDNKVEVEVEPAAGVLSRLLGSPGDGVGALARVRHPKAVP